MRFYASKLNLVKPINNFINANFTIILTEHISYFVNLIRIVRSGARIFHALGKY